jgi:hypothetical protein
MTISSSSGGEMEEFNERVSDIVKSPVIQIWQFSYRQVFLFGLVLIMLGLSSASIAQDDRVTRYNLVSAIYERVFNRQVTELEAINTGLIDAYEDGKFHLDWPVSRGMAAEAFYRLNIQTGSAARSPRAFADIDAESPFHKVLSVVGGAFLPQRRGNFDPNHILSRKDLFRGIQILIEKGVVKQEDRYGIEIDIVNQPVETVASVALAIEEIAAIRPELGFEERRDDLQKFKVDAYKRIARADRQVTREQLDPQVMASVEDATQAMGDVEELLESLGGSVLEMTATYPSNPDDEAVLRQGLAKIEGLLKTIVDRFKNSKLQLDTVMPVNPVEIEKCAALKVRLDKSVDEANLLRKRIAGRLSEPQKGENR